MYRSWGTTVAMVVVAAIALSSATYAWFVNNTQVTAGTVDVTASTTFNLLIADKKDGDYASTMKLDPNEAALTQVSTIGTRAEETSKMSDNTSNEIGDILFVTCNEWEGTMVTSWKTVSKSSVVTVPNSEDKNVMYYTDTAWLKAASASSIYLDSEGTGINWPDWDSDTLAEKETTTFYTYADFVDGKAKVVNPYNSNSDEEVGNYNKVAAYNAKVDQAIALLKTLRVGFKVTQTTGNGATEAADNFYVYALAASDSYVINNTISVDTSTGEADGYTKGVGQTTETKADTAPSEYSSNNITNLTESNVQVLTANTMATGSGTSIGTAGSAAVALAAVNPDEQVQVDIYVWMEGCDYDTVAGNITSFAEANIKGMQFGFCLAAEAADE